MWITGGDTIYIYVYAAKDHGMRIPAFPTALSPWPREFYEHYGFNDADSPRRISWIDKVLSFTRTIDARCCERRQPETEKGRMPDPYQP